MRMIDWSSDVCSSDLVARKWITSNNPTDPARVPFAGFSLRTGGDLAEFIDVIRGASRDLLSATAFALTATVLDALLGTSNDNYGLAMLRFYQHNRFRSYPPPLPLKQLGQIGRATWSTSGFPYFY